MEKDVNESKIDYFDGAPPAGQKSAAAAAIIVPILTTLINGAIGLYNNKQQRDTALENQAYNEPVNQVKRLAEAGINPYAMPSQVNAGQGIAQPKQLSKLDTFFNDANNVVQLQQQVLSNELLKKRLIAMDLSNKFLGDTYENRVAAAGIRNQVALLQAQLLEGKITEQEYAIQIRAALAQYYRDYYTSTDYNAAYGVPYADYPGISPAMYDKRNAMFNVATGTDVNQYRLDNILPIEAAREGMARDFERAFGMPWSQGGTGLHLIFQLLSSLGDYTNSTKDPTFMGFLKYFSKKFGF